MGILDLQNYLSNPATGDSLVGSGDIVGGQVIDQDVLSGLFTGPGGADIAAWATVKLSTALAGATSVQAVIQDSALGVSFTDQILGPVVLLAAALANTTLLQARLLRSHQRYIRVIYRLVGTATGGIAISYVNLDTDQIDLSMRTSTKTITEPTGAADESIAGGILQG